MPKIVHFSYWAANKWKERLEKWESAEAPESLRGNDESCKEELSSHDVFEKLCTRGDDHKKLQVRNFAESDNVGLPRSRTIQFREQTMNWRGPDDAGNLILTFLPQPFRALLDYGMNHLFLDFQGTSQVLYKTGSKNLVYDWAFVCLSPHRGQMVTLKLKSFMENLVCMCRAIGMDLYGQPRCCLWPRFRSCNMTMSKYIQSAQNDLVNLVHILRVLEADASAVQLVLIVLPDSCDGVINKSFYKEDITEISYEKRLYEILENIKMICARLGVIYHQCWHHEVMMHSHANMCLIASEIKDKAAALYITGGDSKAAGLGKEIDENGHHVESDKEIIGDGGSALGSSTPTISADETQEDDSSRKEQDGETQEDDSNDEQESGDGGSEHLSTCSFGFPGSVDDEMESERSIDSDGFPGSDDEMEPEHEWPRDSDGFPYRKKKDSDGFSGSVDVTDSIDPSVLQVQKMGNVKNWACVSFSMSLKETGKFLRKLTQTCCLMGMEFYSWPTSAVHVKPVSSAKVEETLWHMHDTISKIFSIDGQEIGLLFVILPDKEVGDTTHEKIDEVCQKLGFIYQYCSPKDARSAKETYLKTIAHEINNKVVRRDAGLHRNFVMPFVAGKDPITIVFGADTLCSAEEDSNISIASVVATYDWPVSSRYSAFVSEQPNKEVAIKNLHNENKVECGIVRCFLHNFFMKTKKWPSRIIFFRNGVDESQLSLTVSQEIDAINKACTSICKSKLPITYLVVGQAGSAVGEDSSTKFVFSCSYPLVGRTGTNDVAYRVLHDDNNFHADKLKSLCIDLYTERVRWAYPNVSMAPPAYYARLVALHARRAYIQKRLQVSYGGESTTT